MRRESFAERLLAAIASDVTLIPEDYRGELRGGALEVVDPDTGERHRVSVGPPSRCRHRTIWAFAPAGGGAGQLLWCYACGAIRYNCGDERFRDRWVRPVGVGGENPAMKEPRR